MKLGNAEVRPKHYPAVPYASYRRTYISAASRKDFAPLYARLVILLDIDVGGVLADDVLITHGTQAYVKGTGR
jgi:hypothetical protein